jgi:hypothetical protein
MPGGSSGAPAERGHGHAAGSSQGALGGPGSSSSSAQRGANASANAAALQHHLQHRPLRIAFVHPDLGLGGAERLIVDAAAELAARGHVVDIYTSYYDPARCFDETRSGAFSVLVAGGWFPRHVLGRLHALCAVVRCALASLYLAWRVYAGAAPPYDVVIVDQVAAAVPLLKLLLQNSRVLFYCHFPDLLLTHRASLLKALYRAPLDALEQAATGSADLILVNSRFTAGVFAATFERLAARGVAPAVLHPAVAVPPEAELAEAAGAWEGELAPELVALVHGGPTFLSINRCAGPVHGRSQSLRGARFRHAEACRGGRTQRFAGQELPGAARALVPWASSAVSGSGRGRGASCSYWQSRRTNAPRRAPAPRPLRFERKKGVGLALQALHELLQRKPNCGARLIIAGGRGLRAAMAARLCGRAHRAAVGGRPCRRLQRHAAPGAHAVPLSHTRPRQCPHSPLLMG